MIGSPSSAWYWLPSRLNTDGWALPSRNEIGVVQVTPVIDVGGGTASETVTCQ